MVEGLTEDLAEELVSAARTSVGDELRSVTYFTPDDFEQLYLRADLETGADVARFVSQEIHGFEAHDAYGNTELGEFTFVIRVFEHGYLTRVIVGERGVFVTTDELDMKSFEELAAAVRQVLASAR
jgi:predicted Zn-dependent protease